MAVYDPWSHLRRCFPEMRVIVAHPLPDGQLGGIAGRRIWLHRDLDEAGRRSTLAHEIVHLERMRAQRRSPSGRPASAAAGERPEGWCDRREERRVDAIAARRLIDLDRLVDALRWSRDRYEIAADLGVDPEMLAARWHGLGADERGEIERRLELSGKFHE
ncbi:ImmA/IrrE family metallo-endopeptidase [Millisia brevis]|uniref:ImmA/IrrE family metallo-endopeptidase n=1 Tax=Millisia brevis TaxID=264148 RepID=UPI0008309D78|nr:ImmA/IrrE family metallo-endopeptidase [Millisia brevis]